jgi:ATP synthase protein I
LIVTDDSADKRSRRRSSLEDEIGAKATRKLRAQRNASPGIWFGLGTMGLVGWSVAVPTLLGATLGLWLDGRNAGDRHWTLALLVAGLVIGCWNAWHWILREDQAMKEEQEDHDE